MAEQQDNQVQALKAELAQGQHHQAQLEAALNASDAQCAQLQNVNLSLTQQNQQLQMTVADLTAQLNACRAECAALESALNASKAQCSQLESVVASLSEKSADQK